MIIKINIKATRGSKKEIRDYDFMFVAVGRSPNLSFLSEELYTTYKKPKKISHLFIIGDVRNKKYRQISIAMGERCKNCHENHSRSVFQRKKIKLI